VADVARGPRFLAPLAVTALQRFLGASGAGNGHWDDAIVMRLSEVPAPAQAHK
jgi:hypothetical protein